MFITYCHKIPHFPSPWIVASKPQNCSACSFHTATSPFIFWKKETALKISSAWKFFTTKCHDSTLVRWRYRLQKLLLQNFARPLYLWTWLENNETYKWGIRLSIYFVSCPHQSSWISVHWFTSYYGEHKTTRTQHRLSVGRSTVFWKLRLFRCMKIIIHCHRHAKWG
jgi:hypothetical protein